MPTFSKMDDSGVFIVASGWSRIQAVWGLLGLGLGLVGPGFGGACVLDFTMK